MVLPQKAHFLLSLPEVELQFLCVPPSLIEFVENAMVFIPQLIVETLNLLILVAEMGVVSLEPFEGDIEGLDLVVLDFPLLLKGADVLL